MRGSRDHHQAIDSESDSGRSRDSRLERHEKPFVGLDLVITQLAPLLDSPAAAALFQQFPARPEFKKLVDAIIAEKESNAA